MNYSLDYIRSYMNELDIKTNFNSKDIKLSISKRMTRTYAYNQMKYDDPNNFKNRILLNNKMVYSEAILSCGASEKQMKDIIRHEYCHAWADNSNHISSGHSGRFIECCNILKCEIPSRSRDKELSKLYTNYLKINGKQRKGKFNYRNEFEKLTSNVKYLSENNIRVSIAFREKSVAVVLSITEKYPKDKDISYLFDDTIRDITNILINNNDTKVINSMEANIKGVRKQLITYDHLNII